MKQLLLVIFAIFLTVTLIAIAFTINQVSNESQRLESDLERRSILLAESLRETIEPNFINNSKEYFQGVVDKFENRERLAGLRIYDNKENPIAASSTLPIDITDSKKIAADAMDEDKANGDFANLDGQRVYLLAIPIHDQESVVGSLMLVQRADYIDSRLSEIWKNNLTRLFLQILLLSVAVLLGIRWLLFQPIKKLTESLKLLKIGTEGHDSDHDQSAGGSIFFQPLVKEISNIKKSLIEARIAASEEAKINLERLDSPWTKERLREFVKDILKNRKIIVASNTEPFVHSKQGNKINAFMPSSGLVTAIEPVMEACGGTWIAYGSGNGDKFVVDKDDKINLPPQEPKYTLKRIWLTEEEIRCYYNGFSNEGLWPLCHNAHTRHIFRKEDWEEYKNVNLKFAQVLLAEIKNLKRPVILIQDFHLTLVPKLIKSARPDATISLFWHIPWVSAESFSICPWKKEILEGMLGADLIGFHTQLHVNNFIETVERELESMVNFEQFSITHKDHTSYIKTFPISIDFYNDIKSDKNDQKSKEKILKDFGVKTKHLGVGVDRLDYTKGILERLKGIEILFQKYPSYRRHFTFVQIASPSKVEIKKYQDYGRDVRSEVERINEKYKEKDWKPIIYLEKRFDHEELNKIYKAANFCLITSLHDGMNLVAKEFVAARNDEEGVLILSQFAGASRELKDAILINPYNGEQTAEAIHAALKMSPSQQKKRMRKLRQTVRNYNIYRWSAELLRAMVNLA